MQDKKLDELFKKQFEHAEMVPPAGAWVKIEAELQPQKKISFAWLWIAASLVVAVCAITLTLSQPEKIYLQGKLATVAVPKDEVPTLKSAITDPDVAVAEEERKSKMVVKPVKNHQNKSIEKEVVIKDLKNISIAMQPIDETDHLPVKQAAITTEQALTIGKIENTDIMLAQIEPIKTFDDQMIGEIEMPERKGIKNLGDVVNLVVDKLDKREKKLIQFNTDDDDNSSIVALNIGILKFNRKK